MTRKITIPSCVRAFAVEAGDEEIEISCEDGTMVSPFDLVVKVKPGHTFAWAAEKWIVSSPDLVAFGPRGAR